MHPPHLPNPTCSIKNHNRWINISGMLFVAALGLFAGLVGGIITLGWIWPSYGGGDTWVVSQNRAESLNGVLDEVVSKESSEKVFTVYDGAVKLDAIDYLSADDRVGEAVAVSSDGWLALYVAEKSPVFNTSKWRVLSADGAVFEVSQYLWDGQAKIVYIKISPAGTTKDSAATVTQFRVASFEDTIKTLDEVYVHENGDWRYARVGYTKFLPTGSGRLDSAPSRVYQLNSGFAPGSVIVNRRGRVVGFVTENGQLFPGTYLTRILPSVLGGQKIEYPSFGALGWFSEEQPAVSGANQVAGFVVSGLWNKNTKLRRGDIVKEINGQIVHDESLWYNISGDSATLTIMRSGKVFDIPAVILKANGTTH
jgi:hypothetical protein